MIQSMTGFGKAAGTFESKRITAEIRSLNSKQFDLNVRIPGLYKEKELVLRSLASKKLGRGKVELSLYVENDNAQSSHTLNQDLALNYHKDLRSLAEAINEPQSTYLELLMRMPDVMKTERPQLEEAEWKAVEAIVHTALEDLQRFRKTEGETLFGDFKERIGTILNLLKEVEPYEKARRGAIRERINKNLEESVGEEAVDRNRLEQELIYYLEKLDVTEEKVRLKTHCDYFLEILETGSGQGKKLGFVSQEIGREINTLGSKANHADIQKIVVQMKDELEKIKEQLLNVL